MNVWVVYKLILRFYMCCFFRTSRWRDGCNLDFIVIKRRLVTRNSFSSKEFLGVGSVVHKCVQLFIKIVTDVRGLCLNNAWLNLILQHATIDCSICLSILHAN